MRSILVNIFFVAVGAATGIAWHSYSISNDTSSYAANPLLDQHDSASLPSPESNSDPDNSNQSNAGLTKVDASTNLSEINDTAPRAIVQNDVDIVPNKEQNDSFNSAPTDFSFLKGTNLDMVETGELEPAISAFGDWLNSAENPGQSIVDIWFNDSLDKDQSDVLDYLVASSTAMEVHEGLDTHIVQQLALANGENNDDWVDLLDSITVTSSEARTELLNTLQTTNDETVIASGLMAIEPQLLPAGERTQFLSDISVYSDSASDEIKAAAIVSLGRWGAQDYSYLIEDALASGSDEVKASALHAVGSSAMWSDDIQYHLIELLNNESQSLETRFGAFNALTNHSISEQHYADYYRFFERYLSQDNL